MKAALSIGACVALYGILCCQYVIATADSADDRVQVAKGKDGKNDRAGAIWEGTARNKDGKEQTIQFRAKNNVLFVGKQEIGTIVASQKLGDGESTLMFNDSAPLPGKATITFVKDGVWNGTLLSRGKEWTLNLRVKDR